MQRVATLILASAVSLALAQSFNVGDEIGWADKYSDNYKFSDQFGDYQEDSCECGHFSERGKVAACPDLAFILKNLARFNPVCDLVCPKYNDGLPELSSILPYLCRLGFTVTKGTFSGTIGDGDLLRTFPNIAAGDEFIIGNREETHAGIVYSVGSSIGYRDHNNGYAPRGKGSHLSSVVNSFREHRPGLPVDAWVIHPPAAIVGGRTPCLGLNLDSIWGSLFGLPQAPFGVPKGCQGWVYHGWVCCWHENIGGTWPWGADSTGYGCLSWAESSGTTVDSLISPRINCAGCSSLVFMEDVNSNLSHSNATIQVRGSTDDGVTWPFLMGSDSLTDTTMTWAAGQKNVRIAWIYLGRVQKGKYWCIDNVEIWGKPTRRHDVVMSGIAAPCGRISQGQTCTPSVYLQNRGEVPESIRTTFCISGGYSKTKWAKLDPYCDTLLGFDPWTGSPRTDTATAYCVIDSDQFRANDTSTLTFRVVADTWIERYEAYGGHGTTEGAGLAATDSSTIFGVTGCSDLLAKYLINQNLWKTRAPTPISFGSGGGLAYPGGDNIYGLRGATSKCFYGYSVANNKWRALANLPANVRNGSGLACGGGYVFALRGDAKKDFYRYNISTNTWSSMTQTPDPVGTGGCLTGTGGDSIYVLRGNNHTDFYRYRVSPGQWTRLTSIPATPGSGACLTYYPPRRKIYAFRGSGYTTFYVYDIASNSWSTRRSAPGSVKSGGCLAYCNNEVFGALGEGSGHHNFWRYSPPAGGFFGSEEGDGLPAGRRPGDEGVLSSASLGGSFGGEKDVQELLLTNDSNDKYLPRYSPDGNWVAYTETDTLRDCMALYKVGMLGGQGTPLTTDNISDETPKWTPNGASIITSGDSGIYRVRVATGARTRLATGIGANPELMSSGNRIVYERWDTLARTHNVYRVDTSGANDTCLSSDSAEYLQPQPISDTDFVCLKLKDEVYQLCRVTKGVATWLTSDYSHNLNPRLSPDGQRVCYEKLDETGMWQAYQMNVDGTQETRLTNGSCDFHTPVYSADGDYLAYTKWPLDSSGANPYSQVCYIALSQPGVEIALNGTADAVREHPCWSPDGQYIVYQRDVDEGLLDGPGRPKAVKQVARVPTRLKPMSGIGGAGLPIEFALFQNRPNPFRVATAIRYAIPVSAQVDLTIYDLTGRSVCRLVHSRQKPSYYTASWRGTDNLGRKVASGVYYYILKSDGKVAKKRMLLIR